MSLSKNGDLRELNRKLSFALEDALQREISIDEKFHLTTGDVHELVKNPLGTSAFVLVEALRCFHLNTLLEEILVETGS